MSSRFDEWAFDHKSADSLGLFWFLALPFLVWAPPIGIFLILILVTIKILISWRASEEVKKRSEKWKKEQLAQLKAEGIPETLLSWPQKCFELYGFEEAKKAWEEITEPHYRFFKGRSPDWQWRKALWQQTYCVKCGKFQSKDLHHIVSVINGGTHEHSNLVALCKRCHKKEHKTK